MASTFPPTHRIRDFTIKAWSHAAVASVLPHKNSVHLTQTWGKDAKAREEASTGQPACLQRPRRHSCQQKYEEMKTSVALCWCCRLHNQPQSYCTTGVTMFLPLPLTQDEDEQWEAAKFINGYICRRSIDLSEFWTPDGLYTGKRLLLTSPLRQ